MNCTAVQIEERSKTSSTQDRRSGVPIPRPYRKTKETPR